MEPAARPQGWEGLRVCEHPYRVQGALTQALRSPLPTSLDSVQSHTVQCDGCLPCLTSQVSVNCNEVQVNVPVLSHTSHVSSPRAWLVAPTPDDTERKCVCYPEHSVKWHQTQGI